MSISTVTVDEALDIVRRLDQSGRRTILAELSKEREIWWQQAADKGETEMRRLAQARGKNWDALTEDQREQFVDSILHEPA